MKNIDLGAWTSQEDNPERRRLREALHILLHAIASSTILRMTVAMKGGILMAIDHGSSRFTRDVDFSTRGRIQGFDVKAFLAQLGDQLAKSVESLSYDLECLVQSYEVRPPRADAMYPTLQIRVGYAPRSNESALRRLRSKQSPQVIPIDVSFNETTYEAASLHIGDGISIDVYSLVSLIAEKYRSLFQQESRSRRRAQDVYDIAFLIETYDLRAEDMLVSIKAAIETSCESRGIAVTPELIDRAAIRELAERDYQALAATIPDKLPDFDETFGVVHKFYRDLPWNK